MNDDIFCKIISGEIPSLTCYEDDIVKCIMDANPEAPGHTLILPKKHFSDILSIDDETILYINSIAKKLISKMNGCLPNISGVITVINYGAPQTIKHYHMHLIPTYSEKCGSTQEEICELLKRA